MAENMEVSMKLINESQFSNIVSFNVKSTHPKFENQVIEPRSFRDFIRFRDQLQNLVLRSLK